MTEEQTSHIVKPHSKIVIHLMEKIEEETLDALADDVTDLLDEEEFPYSKVDYVE